MNPRFLVQLGLLVLTGFVILRLFPLLLRVVEASALGLAQFWWAILIVALLLALFWFLRVRNRR